ncbi:MAG TPA: sigma-70 family RNA polymerase sigma factor [Gemmatimonadaceae bacterium]|nr:sigma-70 family RNA polymerase sigma factor [Gemmatimonadaceae bacterium]
MSEPGSLPFFHREAFRAHVDRMYRRYQAELHRLAFRVVKAPDPADDVVHEVFRRILEHPEHLPVPDMEKTYLHRATYREALHRIDRARARLQRTVRLQGELPVHAPTPADILRATAVKEALEHAVSELPPRYQRAFRLRYIVGSTRGDAAREMGISAKAVDEEVRRATAMLREQLRRVWLEWRGDAVGER